MTFKRATLLALLPLCFSGNVYAEDKGIAILELFTNQICPDCKPADQALLNIAREQDENIIALGCHVTYFNRETAQDKLAHKFCDERYRAYDTALGVSAGSTPQMIINAKYDTIGDIENTVRAGAKMVITMESVARIILVRRENRLDINLPETQIDRPVELWIFGYDFSHIQNTGKEEDGGTTYEHANAVRHLEKIADWDGSYKNISYDLSKIPADGYTVIAQYADFKGIVAAGKFEED